MQELTAGIKNRKDEMVTKEKCATALGSGGVEVYATPMMILLMEYTCDNSVTRYLEEGMGTVGIKVDVTHISATPVGMKVWCESELINIDGRKLTFSVKAYDEKGLIGEGTHERFIINKEKHYQKTMAKLEK